MYFSEVYFISYMKERRNGNMMFSRDRNNHECKVSFFTIYGAFEVDSTFYKVRTSVYINLRDHLQVFVEACTRIGQNDKIRGKTDRRPRPEMELYYCFMSRKKLVKKETCQLRPALRGALLVETRQRWDERLKKIFLNEEKEHNCFQSFTREISSNNEEDGMNEEKWKTRSKY